MKHKFNSSQAISADLQYIKKYISKNAGILVRWARGGAHLDTIG
jgi:hypothetical protein